MKKSEDEVMQDQDLEYYAAILDAWFTTNLEYDKSIFVLSAGGAGVLVTLLTTRGVESYLALWLYTLGLFGFLLSLVVLLVVFRRNGDHLLDILITKGNPANKVLHRLDKAAMISFGCGMVFSAALGIVTAHTSYTEKEIKMTDSKQNKGTPTFDSVLGAANLSPQAIAQKSFSGAGALRPQAVAQQTASNTSSPASTQASAPAIPSSSPVTPSPPESK